MNITNRILKVFIVASVISLGVINASAQDKKITVMLIDSLTKLPITNSLVTVNSYDNDKPENISELVTNEAGYVVFLVSNTKHKYRVSVKIPGYAQKKAYATFGDDNKDTYIKLKLVMSPQQE